MIAKFSFQNKFFYQHLYSFTRLPVELVTAMTNNSTVISRCFAIAMTLEQNINKRLESVIRKVTMGKGGRKKRKLVIVLKGSRNLKR